MSVVLRRVELSFNVAIVVLAIVLGIVLINKYISSTSLTSSSEPKIGSTIPIGFIRLTFNHN